MAVCTDDTAMQLILSLLIIDHLTVVHQCLDACNKILEVLSQPGYNILEFYEAHIGVDIMCHSLLYSVEEGGRFCLGHSPFLFIACRHPLCMHFQDLVPRATKMYQRCSLLSGHDVVEEEPVLQGMPKMEKEWYASFEFQS